MRHYLLITCTALALLQSGAFAFAEDDKGKNCRMEQQCHWENFKKICVYVKVCR
jgi:hypothetical protein